MTKLNTKSIKYLLTNVEDHSFPSQPTIKPSTDEEKGLFYHEGIQMPLKEKKYIRPIEHDYMSGTMLNPIDKNRLGTCPHGICLLEKTQKEYVKCCYRNIYKKWHKHPVTYCLSLCT